jgi:hypothetical protein
MERGTQGGGGPVAGAWVGSLAAQNGKVEPARWGGYTGGGVTRIREPPGRFPKGRRPLALRY